MSRANPIQSAFNAGELSPRMQARVDRPQYASGCYQLRNFIPDIAGPAVKRGGTMFVKGTAFNFLRSWLVRFELTASESYILEFGDFYIRFFRNRAAVDGGGFHYTIGTPWSAASLTNSDGAFALSYVQSGDIIYIAGGGQAPRKLSRFGDTNWTLTAYAPAGGPFADVNVSAETVTPSAVTGTVTLISSGSIFTSSLVGSLFYIEQPTITGIAQWEAGKVIAVNAIRRVGLRVYQALTAATTGTVTPTHTEGAVLDGDTGVNWQFLHAGYGFGRITAFAGPTQVTLQVLSRLPTTSATTKWAYGAWSNTPAFGLGYPTHVAFYFDRIVWGLAQQLWMTVSSDYENMLDRDAGGRQTVESAIRIFVPSRRGSTMVWMEPFEQSLIVGTGNDEWLIAPASRNEPLGPLNISVQPLGAIGAKQVPAARMFDSIVFVQRTGKRLRDLRYTFNDGLQRTDLNVLADHILGPGVVSLTYAKEPHSLLMAVRTDGKLAVAMYYPEQDLLGWSLWETDGVIECVETIASPDGTTNDVWMIVRRTVGGTDRRFVEYLNQPLGDTEPPARAFYVDSGRTNESLTPISTVSLPHLIGKTVSILADTVRQPDQVVPVSGLVSIAPGASLLITAGLPFTATIASMDMEAGAPAGTAQNKMRRVHRMGVRVDRTLGGRAGPAPNKLDTIRYVPPGSLTSVFELFTGDADFSMRGGSEKVCRAWFVHDDPLPATVLAFMPQLNTDDVS